MYRRQGRLAGHPIEASQESCSNQYTKLAIPCLLKGSCKISVDRVEPHVLHFHARNLVTVLGNCMYCMCGNCKNFKQVFYKSSNNILLFLPTLMWVLLATPSLSSTPTPPCPSPGIPSSTSDFLRFVQGIRSERKRLEAPVIVHCR